MFSLPNQTLSSNLIVLLIYCPFWAILMHQLIIHNTSLNTKNNQAMSKDFKLYESLNIWTPTYLPLLLILINECYSMWIHNLRLQKLMFHFIFYGQHGIQSAYKLRNLTSKCLFVPQKLVGGWLFFVLIIFYIELLVNTFGESRLKFKLFIVS